MTLVMALTAAILFGVGARLLLRRDLLRVVLGVTLISQAATLTLMASALRFGDAPILPVPVLSMSDPLSQAMALTAIVIGFASAALLLVLVLRVATAFHSRELDEVAEEEAERDARLDLEDAPDHAAEEEAAR
jgi:multicomponent Na+:H+ antiporter subunit C